MLFFLFLPRLSFHPSFFLCLNWHSNGSQVSGSTVLTISTSSRLRDYLVTSDSSGYSSEATSPESTSSFDSDSSISSPIFGKGPMTRDQSILDNFPKYMTKFTSKLLDEISIPMSG